MSGEITKQPSLNGFLHLMVEEGASDLILKAGGCPAIRVTGGIRFVGDTPLGHDLMVSYLEQVLERRGLEEFKRVGATDRALSIPGVGRFRCNAFHQCGDVGMVFRSVKSAIPSFTDLNLPADPLQHLAQRRRGLVLATGIAGAGKSTTLAAMLEYINRNANKHIITIEDPIEFLFEDRCSIINQREIGTDAPSFPEALRSAVRQSPDVILIGEMRDRDTVEAAINAAETGHLVLSTLHTVNAVQTVERIVTFFEPHQHDLVRMQLALNLSGVISLRLINTPDGRSMIPACELLMNTPTVRDLLQRGQTRNLPKALEEGGGMYGTMTFNQSLIRLFEAGNISMDDALAASDSPDELKMQMRGISAGGNISSGSNLPTC
ncbi:MAG: PilT/PilU family type 4a pilus ATPase [Planctomycetota bacterium]|nr:PilT/PilU family type 4a pilus ATPase [Planctomycetota bacterium]